MKKTKIELTNKRVINLPENILTLSGITEFNDIRYLSLNPITGDTQIPHKKYIDTSISDAVSGLTFSGITGASNGLIRINDDLSLGGVLNENTNINLSGKNLIYGNYVLGFNIGTGFNSSVWSIIEDSDGKYVIGGAFTQYKGVAHNRIIRLNADGSVDNTFNTGIGFGNNIVYSIIEDSDGKYVIGGSFTTYTGTTYNRIIRLNQNGSVDTTFGIGTGFGGTSDVRSIIEDSDGKYIIGGTFTTYTGATHNRIIRLNKNGSVDATFNKGTGFGGSVYSIIEDSDGKYVIGGTITSYTGATHNRIIRLNKDGSVDTTFVKGTGFGGTIWSIVEDNDGKYVVGGEFTTYTGAEHNRIIRLNKDGSVDITFNKGIGFNSSSIVYKIIADGNGKYLIGGSFTTYTGATHNRIIRLNKNGSIDTTFNKGTGFSHTVYTILRNNSGKYVIGGAFTQYKGVAHNRIIRLNADGSVNNINETYDVVSIGGNIVNYISDVSNNYTNRSLVDRDYVNSRINDSIDYLSAENAIIRNNFAFKLGGALTENTQIKLNQKSLIFNSISTFIDFNTGFNGRVYSIIEDSDGKYVIVGGFTQYKGVTSNRIIRLNSDGSIDVTFNIGIGFDNAVESIIEDSDGKYVIVGHFTTYNGASHIRIIRLNKNGSVDNTFNKGTGFNDYSHTIIEDSDGKYLILGRFSTYNNLTYHRLVKLNKDGSVDSSFKYTTGTNNGVRTIIQDSNGKYVIGGEFTTYTGGTDNRIIRLNKDGSVDTTIDWGTGFGNNAVYSIIEDSDGKYVIGGAFTQYKGVAHNRIIRLYKNGSVDNTFAKGTGFGNNAVNSIIEDSDGKYVIGGSFTTYTGAEHNRIIRLNKNGSIDTTFVKGTGFNNTIESIIEDSDGKYLIGGDFITYNSISQNYITTLMKNGSLNTFAVDFNLIVLTGNTIKYGDDFSNDYNNRSFVDKEYVDNISTIVAINGISKDNQNIKLGGNLIENTNINLNENKFKYVKNIIGLNFGSGLNSNAYSTIIQDTDGRYVVGGGFTTYTGTTYNRIIRLNQNGGIDTTFGIGTGFGSAVNSVIEDSDGKYVIGGGFTTYQSVTNNRIIKLNKNGTKDSSFNNTTGFNNTVNCIIEDGDEYLVVGIFTTYKSVANNRIIRLNKDGFSDSTFNTGTGFSDGGEVRSIICDSDGKYVVVGNFITYNGMSYNRIIRLNKNGTVDNTFNIGSGFNAIVYSIIEDSDGKYVVVGSFTEYNGQIHNRVIRLNKDGSVDMTLNKGSGFMAAAWSIIEDGDGKYVVGGAFTHYRGMIYNRLIRLNRDGTIDGTFNISDGFAGGAIWNLIENKNGDYVITGDFTSYNSITYNRIISLDKRGFVNNVNKNFDLLSFNKYTVDGGLNLSQYYNSRSLVDKEYVDTISITGVTNGINKFNQNIKLGGVLIENTNINLNENYLKFSNGILGFKIGFGFDDEVSSILDDGNGKYLIVGRFTKYDNVPQNKITRLYKNGTVDNTFNTGNGFGINGGSVVLKDSDGKYVIGGSFLEYSGQTHNNIIRLNANGTVDNTFNKGTGFGSSSRVNSIIEDSDGKYVIGGNFTTYTGATHNRIIRLNKDGSVDNTFNKGTGFNGDVWSIIEDIDGKYIIGGTFTTYTGASHNRIIRLNKDGSIDTTFVKGTGFGNNIVYSIIEDSDGKYIIGGTFTTYTGATHNRIIRLNKNGSVDATFNKGTGFGNNTVFSIIEDSDGKYVIGGSFTTYTGATHNRIIRLNKDGSVNVDINYDVLIYSGNTVNYISNVSSNYTNRSLVDKEYVDVNSFIDGVYTITSNNYTATTNNDFIGIQTGVTDIWLPSLPKTKQKLVISDIGGNAFSNNITIYGNGNNIKNNATYIIDSDYGSITIFWNGTFWSVISIVI